MYIYTSLGIQLISLPIIAQYIYDGEDFGHPSIKTLQLYKFP